MKYLSLIFSLWVCSGAFAQVSPPNFGGRFNVEGATVFDEQTGLRWQRCSVGQRYVSNGTCQGTPKKFNFYQAQKQTKINARSEGIWRLPTKNELATLVDITATKLKIDTVIFPDVSDANRFYWTCDLYADGAAWYVDFQDGYVGYMSGDHSSADDLMAVRLVRVER